MLLQVHVLWSPSGAAPGNNRRVSSRIGSSSPNAHSSPMSIVVSNDPEYELRSKFAEVVDADQTLQQACENICARFMKMYPDEDPLVVEKVMDGCQCDLDPDYKVKDVFEHRDVCYIVSTRPRQSDAKRRKASLGTPQQPAKKRRRSSVWVERGVQSQPQASHGRSDSLELTDMPLGSEVPESEEEGDTSTVLPPPDAQHANVDPDKPPSPTQPPLSSVLEGSVDLRPPSNEAPTKQQKKRKRADKDKGEEPPVETPSKPGAKRNTQKKPRNDTGKTKEKSDNKVPAAAQKGAASFKSPPSDFNERMMMRATQLSSPAPAPAKKDRGEERAKKRKSKKQKEGHEVHASQESNQTEEDSFRTSTAASGAAEEVQRKEQERLADAEKKATEEKKKNEDEEKRKKEEAEKEKKEQEEKRKKAEEEQKKGEEAERLKKEKEDEEKKKKEEAERLERELEEKKKKELEEKKHKEEQERKKAEEEKKKKEEEERRQKEEQERLATEQAEAAQKAEAEKAEKAEKTENDVTDAAKEKEDEEKRKQEELKAKRAAAAEKRKATIARKKAEEAERKRLEAKAEEEAKNGTNESPSLQQSSVNSSAAKQTADNGYDEAKAASTPTPLPNNQHAKQQTQEEPAGSQKLEEQKKLVEATIDSSSDDEDSSDDDDDDSGDESDRNSTNPLRKPRAVTAPSGNSSRRHSSGSESGQKGNGANDKTGNGANDEKANGGNDEKANGENGKTTNGSQKTDGEDKNNNGAATSSQTKEQPPAAKNTASPKPAKPATAPPNTNSQLELLSDLSSQQFSVRDKPNGAPAPTAAKKAEPPKEESSDEEDDNDDDDDDDSDDSSDDDSDSSDDEKSKKKTESDDESGVPMAKRAGAKKSAKSKDNGGIFSRIKKTFANQF